MTQAVYWQWIMETDMSRLYIQRKSYMRSWFFWMTKRKQVKCCTTTPCTRHTTNNPPDSPGVPWFVFFSHRKSFAWGSPHTLMITHLFHDSRVSTSMAPTRLHWHVGKFAMTNQQRSKQCFLRWSFSRSKVSLLKMNRQRIPTIMFFLLYSAYSFGMVQPNYYQHIL